MERGRLTPDRLFASRLNPLRKCPLKNKWTLYVSVICFKAVLPVPINMGATCPRRYPGVSFEVAVTKEEDPARWNRKLTTAFYANAPTL